MFGDDDLGLDRVAFLFAEAPASLFAAWALDWLLRAIDDECFGFFTVDFDRARDAENLDRQPLDPPQRPADGRLVRLVQTRQKILRHTASVQNEQHQQMFLKPANTPGPSGPVLWRHNPLPPMRAQSFDHRLECSGINAGQGSEQSLAQKPRAVKLRHWKVPPAPSDLESHYH
mgnify:CR=1 FL=1